MALCGPAFSAGAETSRGSGPYFVQLNAFAKPDNASAFARKLAAKGYDVFVVTGSGGVYHKVRLGPFDTWLSAQRVARKLKRQEHLSPLIVASVGNDQSETIRFHPPEAKAPEPTASPQFIPDPDEPGAQPVSLPDSEEKKEPSKEEQGDSEEVDRIMTRFLSWKEAWEIRNIPLYLSFYSAEFDATPKSRGAWEKSRHKALKRHSGIRVEVSEVQIDQVGDRFEMRFIQQFESNEYRDTGHKTLVWVREQNTWKIIRETWGPV